MCGFLADKTMEPVREVAINGSWYDDMDEMVRDDAALQRIYRSLRTGLTAEARHRTNRVHVYPSRRCSYTIAKRRIFIKVRDDAGRRIPDCVLRHVILHELAHTLNETRGHDEGFRRWMRWLQRGGNVDSCAERVPKRYNPCIY